MPPEPPPADEVRITLSLESSAKNEAVVAVPAARPLKFKLEPVIEPLTYSLDPLNIKFGSPTRL